MPDISVIVPVYNVEAFLRRCVDSILQQTYTDFEIILVDDGSPDRSGEICDDYAEKDNRIHVIHQSNGGLSAARNAGLEWVFTNSNSNWISFIDSDDWIHPFFLQLLHDGIIQYDVNICQCRYLETNGTEPTPAVEGTLFCITPDEQFIKHYSAYMCDKLFAKSCWQGIRFPEGLLYEDVTIWYKILFAQQKIAFVNEVLYYYYANPNSIVRMDWTTAHFARIIAWDNIIDYLSKYNNKAVFANSIFRYCHIAKRHFDEIEQSDAVNWIIKRKYKIRVKYRIFKILMKYKNEMISTGIFDYFFNWSFPFMGWLFWTCKGVVGKIKDNRESGRD